MIDLETLKRLRSGITKGKWEIITFPNGLRFIRAPREKPEHRYDIEIMGEDTTWYSTKEGDIDAIALLPELLDELIMIKENQNE